MGLATNALFRNIRLAWTNNDATGSEVVQLFAKPAGGAWSAVSQTAVVLGDQVSQWATALPLTAYSLAMRYLNGNVPAVGYEDSDPDLWTAATASQSKTTITTSSEAVAWGSVAFVSAATPLQLIWSSAQLAVPYLLEKNPGSGWVTVVADLVATSYAYTIPPAEVGTTVSFRVTAQRGATVGPTAGVLMVPMVVTVAQPTWVSAVFDAMNTGYVALTWNAASGALTYLLEKNAGAGWVSVATVGVTTYNYTPLTAEINTTVNFRLTGQNGATSSVVSASEPVALTVTLTPATLLTFARVGSTQQATATWSLGAGPIGSQLLLLGLAPGPSSLLSPGGPYAPSVTTFGPDGSFPHTIVYAAVQSRWSFNTDITVQSNVLSADFT